MIEPPVPVESVAESISWREVTIQPAGVGGTGPSEVPICGGSRVLGRIPGPGTCLEDLSIAPVALWDREEEGGGPGGGPGRDMPGSQIICRVGDRLSDPLLALDNTPPGPMALVDTALLDDGATMPTSAVTSWPLG